MLFEDTLLQTNNTIPLFLKKLKLYLMYFVVFCSNRETHLSFYMLIPHIHTKYVPVASLQYTYLLYIARCLRFYTIFLAVYHFNLHKRAFFLKANMYGKAKLVFVSLNSSYSILTQKL